MTSHPFDTERPADDPLGPAVGTGTANEVPESALWAAVDASPLAIVTLDLRGQVMSWNASAERMFGWSALEVLGRPSPTVPPELQEESDAVLREVQSGAVVTGLRRRRVRKDGTVIMVAISTAPFSDREGQVRGTVIIAEDITEAEQAEEERGRLLARERAARARAEAAAERIARLQRVSAALSEALTPPEVADVILTQGIEALEASAGVISRLNRTTERLEVVAATGYPDQLLRDFASFPLDAPYPLSHAVRSGEPVWVETPEQWRQTFPELQRARTGLQLNASAGIPLIVKGSPIGALGLSFERARVFTEDERRFALSLAQQCAQALERSRLYEAEHLARAEAETARHRSEFLSQASITLGSSLDYRTTLASVARLAVPRIADWCSVYIVDESGAARLLEVAHVDPDKVALAHELNARYPLDPDAPSGASRVLRTGEPELVPFIPDEMLVEVTEDPDLLATLRALGLVSAMTVPLAARGRVLGAITFISARPTYRFGDDDLALACELASRAAIAVDNARLLRETQQGALEREAILGQIADGIVIANAAGEIVFANAAAASLLGPELIGTPPAGQAAAFHAVAPDGSELPSDRMPLVRATLGRETIVNEDVSIHRPPGIELIIECSATPVVTEDGTSLGGVVSFRDVTSQRTLERQKDDFLSAAAHDLKTPLTTIKGLAQILSRRAARADTPETRGMADGLQRIDATATRMTGLINELLDTSRVQLGKRLDLVRSRTDLVELLRHIAEDQQHTTDRHDVVLQCDSPELWGSWDASRLERAFTNLVSNAITYSPDGGRVVITLRGDADRPGSVTVGLDDEGLGIPAADLPHIFDRFHRGSNVAGRIPGTGIGLAGAREIFRQHGGSIAVRNRAEGGSSFEVTLPLEPPDEALPDTRRA